MSNLFQYIESGRDRFLEELKAFLRLPSVSTDPVRREEVRACAAWVADHLAQLGMESEVWETPGHPLVYAEWSGLDSAPTLLVYGHYDVQPPDPLDEWETGPFEPSVRDGKVYARGATDDKGQLFIHLKAAEAYLQNEGALPVNLKFLVEGEEEVGSDHLEPMVRDRQEALRTDVVAISDSPMFAPGLPSICYGLRGLVYFEVRVRGPNRDLHSGSFGGTVVNPANALVGMLARLVDEQGRVTVPGFYDDVRPLTPEEREAFAALPYDEGAYREDLGVPALGGEVGFSPLERVWARPSLDVNGIYAGFTGEGAKTVLPARAMAKVSMRLVPDQDPEWVGEALEAHLRELAPPEVAMEITRMHGARPWLGSREHPAFRAAARALAEGFGRAPVFIREGGSIPIIPTFEEVLGAPTVLMGIGLPNERAHAPNEHLDLGNFYAGIRAAAHFYRALGEEL